MDHCATLGSVRAAKKVNTEGIVANPGSFVLKNLPGLGNQVAPEILFRAPPNFTTRAAKQYGSTHHGEISIHVIGADGIVKNNLDGDTIIKSLP